MIAVVIPVRDGARWLSEALDSVRAQGDVVSEIVVVDDGSTDSTRQLLATQPDVVAVHHAESLGPAAARNAGVAASSSPLLAFLDVDDLYTDDALAQRAEMMRKGPFDLVVTRVVRRAMDEHPGGVPDMGHGWWAFSFGAALVSRDAWARVGPIDESLLRGEDAEWWLRARDAGLRIHRSDRVTLVVRMHADSWAGALEQRTSATFDVIRRRLAER
jgi:glycosyltransferase involved in cell wall biosynthesis